MKRLAIVSPMAYPVFAQETKGPIGGAETRIAFLARGLVRRGHWSATVIVQDHGQPAVEMRDGVELRKRAGETPAPSPAARPMRITRASIPEWRRGGPASRAVGEILDAFHRAIRPLRAPIRRWKAAGAVGFVGEHAILDSRLAVLREAAPSAYTAAPAGTLAAAETAYLARASGVPFVFMASSDAECLPSFRRHPHATGPFGLAGYVHAFAIENAAAHVVQTSTQAAMLRQGWGKEAIVIRNPISLAAAFARVGRGSVVLWVGKSSWIKNPTTFLALAHALPSLRFRMVVNPVDSELHSQSIEAARRLANLELLEHVPPGEMERHFADARLLVNTSAFEGFPNTFLQAAKYGVPIVTTGVDPDGMLSNHGAGVVAHDDLAGVVARLASADVEYDAIADRARTYVRQHHEGDAVVAAFETVLDRVLHA